MELRAVALLSLVLMLTVLSPELSSQSRGIPVLFRGSVVGCIEQPRELAVEMAALFGESAIYFFGIHGCPECGEMERYLRNLLPGDRFTYVDILQHSDFFKKIVNFLSRFVEDRYITEVPVVFVVRNSSVIAVSIGVFYSNTYWEKALFGDYVEECYLRDIKKETYSTTGLVAGAIFLGAVSALSPCILYLYTALVLSYSTSAIGNPLPKLLLFVLGLGLGYSLILVGLRGVLWFVKPFSWILIVAFGTYMILHSRGMLGCLLGGRSCRDAAHLPSAGLTAVFGKLFPFLMGSLSSLSAVPCSAGYFVLLQAATEGSDALLGLLMFTYVVGFTAPYLVFSIFSSRLIKLVERFIDKVALVELAGGIALIAVGLYIAIAT
ncbi:MAG: cytochrome c biogenesis protein CcdA [Sulfolobales archaeon]|nr:hypothetical protein [Sulfolobales archaeon]MDW8082557.1 cytochrome c biogenesis protein CcdA [Sulfolobales archaeon]